jgi:hypothetical protein
MPYKPGKFLYRQYDPIPAQKAARLAHDRQICVVVGANSQTYRVRFSDGVIVDVYENEISDCLVTTTFWGGRGGH